MLEGQQGFTPVLGRIGWLWLVLAWPGSNVCADAIDDLPDPTLPDLPIQNTTGPSFCLRLIIAAPDRQMAVIDDLRLRPGDAVAGGKLVAVAREGIRITLQGKEHHLKPGDCLFPGT